MNKNYQISKIIVPNKSGRVQAKNPAFMIAPNKVNRKTIFVIRMSKVKEFVFVLSTQVWYTSYPENTKPTSKSN